MVGEWWNSLPMHRHMFWCWLCVVCGRRMMRLTIYAYTKGGWESKCATYNIDLHSYVIKYIVSVLYSFVSYRPIACTKFYMKHGKKFLRLSTFFSKSTVGSLCDMHETTQYARIWMLQLVGIFGMQSIQ